jgi:hypothetical protein
MIIVSRQRVKCQECGVSRWRTVPAPGQVNVSPERMALAVWMGECPTCRPSDPPPPPPGVYLSGPPDMNSDMLAVFKAVAPCPGPPSKKKNKPHLPKAQTGAFPWGTLRSVLDSLGSQPLDPSLWKAAWWLADAHAPFFQEEAVAARSAIFARATSLDPQEGTAQRACLIQANNVDLLSGNTLAILTSYGF